MQLFRQFFEPDHTARIESIHFESLTLRTLVLAPGPQLEPNGTVYLALRNPQDGRVHGRSFAVVPERTADPRYEECSRRRRGRIYVSVPVVRGDWLGSELALRSRKGDALLCRAKARRGLAALGWAAWNRVSA